MPACLLTSPLSQHVQRDQSGHAGGLSGPDFQKLLLPLWPRIYPPRSCILGRSGSTRRWRREQMPRSCFRNTVPRRGAKMGPSWCGRARPSPTTTPCPSGRGIPPYPCSGQTGGHVGSCASSGRAWKPRRLLGSCAGQGWAKAGEAQKT